MNQAEEAILSVLKARPAGKSIEPAEAARLLDVDNWRGRLTEIKAAGRLLAAAGTIEVLRKGKPVDAATARGVIPYRLKADVA